MTATLTLWWGDPGLAGQYRADLLQAADRQRAGHARAPRAELDWRVSRALLQQVRAAWPAGASPALSLSHARGHALVAAAPAGWRVGVDLEALRARDTAALAQWCCTGDERAALAACDGEARRRAFYQLWTLKESFIKAAGLDFPADMRSVGLAPGPRAPSGPGPGSEGAPWRGWRLRAPGSGWHAWSAVLDQAWAASIVWCQPDIADSRAPDNAAADGPCGPDGVHGANVAGATDDARAPHCLAPAWRTAEGVIAPRILPAGRWR
ncbi:4'-phosphopantetheinyl transferase family protein [Bordetella sp. H567]|uniref:4'-phosphopantetheinyl transferase family protein n=1 Tax=Bordetella sp. H567 TaxID=1697043 RepID=UPI00082FAD53|nr:4'-phosphopantetheinyl transferase superfamily protein [Bordetella sp. H567]